MAPRKPKAIKCALCGEVVQEILSRPGKPDILNCHILCAKDPRGQKELRSQIKRAKKKQPTVSIYDIYDHL